MNKVAPLTEEEVRPSELVALRPLVQEEEGWCGTHVDSVKHLGGAENLVSGNAVHRAQAQGKAAVKQMDSNKDGVVDLAEFAAMGGTKEEFNRLDRNGDVVLDADEMALRSELLETGRRGSVEKVKRVSKIGPLFRKSQVETLLAELGVDKETRAKFAQENLTPESLIEFSNEEFRELGINAGLRYRIRQRSAEVIKDEDYSSAPCPDYLTELPENLTTAATGPKHPEPRGGRKCYVDVGFEGVCAWHAKR
jgi:hypothetical protein